MMETGCCSCSRSRQTPCPVPPSHPVPIQRLALLIYPHLVPPSPSAVAEKTGSPSDVKTRPSTAVSASPLHNEARSHPQPRHSGVAG